MKVRFIAPGQGSDGQRRSPGFRTVGHEYVVLAIRFANDRGTRLLLLGDHPPEPSWAEASDYDLVSDEVPSNWRIRVGDAGRTDMITIAPASWLAPGFFEDYWSEDPERGAAAEATFQHELKTIIGESGSAAAR